MSYQRERDEFMATMAKEGVSVDTARTILRHAATLDRLAVAQCNGDWPADNGERTVKACAECEMMWVPSTLVKGRCQDCRTADRVRALLTGTGIEPVFSGDPRGAVVKLQVPSGRTDDWGGTGICVPVRER